VKPQGGWETTSAFQAKLRTYDVNGFIGFAESVSLGNGVVVVGAPLDHPKGQQYGQGAAFVFEHQ
jgi:hypothetical protein